VRAYRISLAPGQSLGPITIPGPSIRIAMNKGRISEKSDGRPETALDLAPAKFWFRDQTTTATIRNEGADAVELVEFELK
jgi:hypothetical protein